MHGVNNRINGNHLYIHLKSKFNVPKFSKLLHYINNKVGDDISITIN